MLEHIINTSQMENHNLNIVDSLKEISKYSVRSVSDGYYPEVDYASNNNVYRSAFMDEVGGITTTIAKNRYVKSGTTVGIDTVSLSRLINIVINEPVPGYHRKESDGGKSQRCIMFPYNGETRLVGNDPMDNWNGFQIVDLDLKDVMKATIIKNILFDKLSNYTWFVGIAFSFSGTGLHVYTKIKVPETARESKKKMFIQHTSNYYHKSVMVYLAMLSELENRLSGFDLDPESLVRYMDNAMSKPAQGNIVGYDSRAKFSTNFIDDFITTDFNVISDIYDLPDWYENIELLRYFGLEQKTKTPNLYTGATTTITGDESLGIYHPDLTPESVPQLVMEYNLRWPIVNLFRTVFPEEYSLDILTKMFSVEEEDKFRRQISGSYRSTAYFTSNLVLEDVNKKWGFKFKRKPLNNKPLLKTQRETLVVSDIQNSIDKCKSPIRLVEPKDSITLNIDEYLTEQYEPILNNIGKCTLLDAGAGYGKTTMVTKMIQDHKVLMVMPFVSTLQSKMDGEDGWSTVHSNKKMDLSSNGVAMTIDKYTKVSDHELVDAGFNYVVIDESHLMFQSKFRSVMSDAIDRVKNSPIKTLLMTGTNTGEMAFMDDIKHIHINKKDTRKKIFNLMVAEFENDRFNTMCLDMATDLVNGKKILFPTNAGSKYYEKIKVTVEHFLTERYNDVVSLQPLYYKKANAGDVGMSSINNEGIFDGNFLCCTTYLSVGVDIHDKSDWSIYFDSNWIPQDIEQFSNRLRKKDLIIKYYISKFNKDGKEVDYTSYNEMQLPDNSIRQEVLNIIMDMANKYTERSEEQYLLNQALQSILSSNISIKFNDKTNKYFIDDTTNSLEQYEDAYREYATQLPVLIKGMIDYGYEFVQHEVIVSSLLDQEPMTIKGKVSDKNKSLIIQETADMLQFIERMTESRLDIYKSVMRGEYQLEKGDAWGEDVIRKVIICKDTELFNKILPPYMSMTKSYDFKTIIDVFNHCIENGKMNWSLLIRLKSLMTFVRNQNKDKVDIPVLIFRSNLERWLKTASARLKEEIDEFIENQACIFLKQSTNANAENSYKVVFDTKKSLRKLFNFMTTKNKGANGLSQYTLTELNWEPKKDKNANDIISEDDFFVQLMMGA